MYLSEGVFVRRLMWIGPLQRCEGSADRKEEEDVYNESTMTKSAGISAQQGGWWKVRMMFVVAV